MEFDNVGWGSPILFSWRVNGHFCFALSVNEDLFFRDSWIYNFPSSGNWFSVFSWSVKYAFTFSWFVNQRLLREYFFTFLEILTSLKLVNYTKLDVKPAPSMRLRMENWSRTNHSDSEPRGPKICNYGQESWEKFTLWTKSPPIPNRSQYNVENYLQFHLIFSIVFERGKVTWKAALFSNLTIKTEIVR